MPQQQFVLASASPRRRQLLALGRWDISIAPTDTDETVQPGESPESLVRRLSETKARRAAAGAPRGTRVIGADTAVVLDGQIIGKPADGREAARILRQLRGRAHDVLTGLTVYDSATGQAHTQVARSRVPMRHYADAEIEAYVATGDPLDKAGAYAIQNPGFQPVDTGQFADCFANVMGLPLCHLLRQLRQLGVEPETDLPAECQRALKYDCPVFEGILKGRANGE